MKSKSFTGIICLSLILSGCATTSTPAQRATDIQSVTQTAVTLALDQDAGLRPSFQKADDALAVAIATGATNPTLILAALHQVIPAANQAAVDKALTPVLNEFANDLPAIKAGLDAALSATAPKAPTP